MCGLIAGVTKPNPISLCSIFMFSFLNRGCQLFPIHLKATIHSACMFIKPNNPQVAAHTIL